MLILSNNQTSVYNTCCQILQNLITFILLGMYNYSHFHHRIVFTVIRQCSWFYLYF